jgi:hypothetical protein
VHGHANPDAVESTTTRIPSLQKESKMAKMGRPKLAVFSKHIKVKTINAYLYLLACCRKFEANMRKGRQKKGNHHNYYMKR